MNIKVLANGLGVFFLLLGAAAYAADWYVAPNGNDGWGGSEEQPWLTIQHAIDAVTGSPSQRQYIHIAAGTYNERLLMDSDDVYESLVGAGASVTIVDAQQGGKAFYGFNSHGIEISGLTFQNGQFLMGGHGPTAAVSITGDGNVIHDCVVRWSQGLYEAGLFFNGSTEAYNCESYGNETPDMNGWGAGLYIANGAAGNGHAHHLYIHDNTSVSSEFGSAGIFIGVTNAVVEDCVFEKNYSSGTGAVFIKGGTPTFRRNIIRDNTGENGEIVRLEDSQPIFENNLVVDNHGDSAVYVTGGFAIGQPYSFALNTIINEGAGVTWINCPAPDKIAPILNSIIWVSGESLQISNANLALSYSCLSDELFSGEGVIYADPLFLQPAAGDYHLSADSPCIDAGNPASEFCAEPWPNGCRINLGAYGNTIEAELSLVLTCTPTCPPTPSPTPTDSPTPTSSPIPTAEQTSEPTTTPPTPSETAATASPGATRTPTPALTVTPSFTSTPTLTPSITAAPSGTNTPANSYTPVLTPTPSTPPTLTPSPTPSATGLDLRLSMSSTILRAGDELLLELEIINHGPELSFDQYICLDVYGLYYFYPSWSEAASSLRRTLGATSYIRDVLLDLLLPAPLAPDGPFVFLGLLIDPDSGQAMTDLVSVAFVFV